jgi:hypothetical protein
MTVALHRHTEERMVWKEYCEEKGRKEERGFRLDLGGPGTVKIEINLQMDRLFDWSQNQVLKKPTSNLEDRA